MDLRSIKPGMQAAMRHPKTGELLEPVYVWKDGRVSWPVLGASPDDDSNSGQDEDAGEEDDEGESEEDDQSEDEDSDDDAEKGKKKKNNPEAKIKALEEEKDRHYKNAKKQKKRADELEAQLKALQDKDLKPEDKDKRDREAQQARDKAAEASTQKLRLENAFLKANEIDWVKPEQALALLLADPDEYEVEFDDSGNVDRKSLRAELRRLAKANSHLVKPKQSKGKDDEEDADDAGSQRQTASTMNGTRKGKGKAKSREELAKRFPALNRIGG